MAEEVWPDGRPTIDTGSGPRATRFGTFRAMIGPLRAMTRFHLMGLYGDVTEITQSATETGNSNPLTGFSSDDTNLYTEDAKHQPTKTGSLVNIRGRKVGESEAPTVTGHEQFAMLRLVTCKAHWMTTIVAPIDNNIAAVPFVHPGAQVRLASLAAGTRT